MTSPILQTYFKEINKYPLLSKEEEEKLILRAQFGDQDAKNLLVISNLRFVVTIAKKFVISKILLEDLIQEGNIGLLKSIDKFDPSKKVKFLSYAVWWIKQSIYSYLNEHSRTIRLSLNQIRDNNKYTKERENLIVSTENEHASPSDDFNYNNTHTFSIDDTIEDMNLIEIMEDPNFESPDRSLIAESLYFEIQKMLESLNEREQEILMLYYGIGYDRAYTLDEIGERLELTRERVRQIKELTLNRLSLKPKFKDLVHYLE